MLGKDKRKIFGGALDIAVHLDVISASFLGPVLIRAGGCLCFR